MSKPEEIKVKIHEKLLETGEYEKYDFLLRIILLSFKIILLTRLFLFIIRMKVFLRNKLQESGWFDEINVLALGK